VHIRCAPASPASCPGTFSSRHAAAGASKP
jgi:hypothetical protein